MTDIGRFVEIKCFYYSFFPLKMLLIKFILLFHVLKKTNSYFKHTITIHLRTLASRGSDFSEGVITAVTLTANDSTFTGALPGDGVTRS